MVILLITCYWKGPEEGFSLAFGLMWGEEHAWSELEMGTEDLGDICV